MLRVLFMREADVESLCWSFLWLHHEFVLFIAEEDPNEVMGFSLPPLADFIESSQEIDVLLPLVKDQTLKGMHPDLYLLCQ